jgi:hypothetical protein
MLVSIPPTAPRRAGAGLDEVFEPELWTPPIRRKVLVGPDEPEELNGMLVSIPPTAPRRAGAGLDEVFTLDQN